MKLSIFNSKNEQLENLKTIKEHLVSLIKEKFKAEHLLLVGFSNVAQNSDVSSSRFMEMVQVDFFDFFYSLEDPYHHFEIVVENDSLKTIYHNEENGNRHIQEIFLLKNAISEKTASKMLNEYAPTGFLKTTLKNRAYQNFGKSVFQAFDI